MSKTVKLIIATLGCAAVCALMAVGIQKLFG